MENYSSKYVHLKSAIDLGLEEHNAKDVLRNCKEMIRLLEKGFRGFPTLTSQYCVYGAQGALFAGKNEEAINFLKKSVRLDKTFYGENCDFQDVKEIVAMLPFKWRTQFPWKHVLQV